MPRWTRSDVIGLAKASCTFCDGFGMRPVLRGPEQPCACVFRAIFRACLRRYRECGELAHHTAGVSWDRCAGPLGFRTYSRKREEFRADFVLTARRTLEPPDLAIFERHSVEGHDWHVCCRELRLDRGTFFHRVYFLEERLGRTLAELRPYALYPCGEYFGGSVARDAAPEGPIRAALCKEGDAVRRLDRPYLAAWGVHFAA